MYAYIMEPEPVSMAYVVVLSSPKNNVSSISGYNMTRVYLAQTHFRKWEAAGNCPHQNILVTWTELSTRSNILIYEAILKPI
jgi:hypothetical protein